MAILPDMWRDPAIGRGLPSSFGYSGAGSWRPLLRQLDDLFNEVMDFDQPSGLGARSMVPACDCEETDQHYLLSFEMPGIDKKDIDIEIRGRQLLVSGEKKPQHMKGQSERRYSRLERIVTLPGDVKVEDVEASYDNGILTVAIPKELGSTRKKIKIGEGKSGFFQRLLAHGDKEKDMDERKATDEQRAASDQSSQTAS